MPGSRGFKFEHFLKLRSERSGKLRLGYSEPIEIFQGKIDPAHFEISADVANDVGQLEREAQAFCQIRSFRITETENVQAGEADRACYTITVFGEAVECSVGRNRQIHLRAQNQIMKVARRNFEARNSVGQSRKNCVGGSTAGDCVVEHCTPARKSFALRI